ncbi:MAG: CerR family C-terminal domain-containing protein [Akkermansiaceae bacterium]|nr:CerR family C-terminal domain-containing protein [Akkermansiaceae bacterium]MCF7732957.1 CerR family C-terminal domain-containing protein [Akkermansiaceae bacterium]
MATDSTQQRLLQAAIHIFASKGYYDATVADICEAAGANIAAVNYHFNGKENLFRHVLRAAFHQANAVYPIEGTLPPDAPAEDKLRAFMDALIRRGLDPGGAGDFNRIMVHHGTREAAPEDLVFTEVSGLQGNTLTTILTELLGTSAKDRIAQARLNVIGLCIFPNIAHLLRRQLLPDHPSPARVRRFIDGQFAFALAGLVKLSPVSA